MLALLHLNLFSMPCGGVKNVLRLASLQINVGLHPLVQRLLRFYELLMLMLNPKSQRGPHCPHRFKPNMILRPYTRIYMRNLLKYTFEYQSQHGLFSIDIRWGFADNHTNPVARHASWSSKQPQPVTTDSKNHEWVGPYSATRLIHTLPCVCFDHHTPI